MKRKKIGNLGCDPVFFDILIEKQNMKNEIKNILIVDCGPTLSANQVSENKTLKTFEVKKDFEITANRVNFYTPLETRAQRRKRKRKNK